MTPSEIEQAMRRAVDDCLAAEARGEEVTQSWHAGHALGYLAAFAKPAHLLPLLAQERYFALGRPAAFAVMYARSTERDAQRRVAWASGMHRAWCTATEGWPSADTCRCGVRIVIDLEQHVACDHGVFCSQTCRSRLCDGTDDPADDARADAA